MANVEFGTGKTVLILTIVAACFAVLWPKIFYPMLIASPSAKTTGDNLNGCCDVIFETDVNAIKIMTEMCGTILSRHEDLDPKLAQAFQQGKLSKEIVNTCRSEVLNICGIDIAEFLSEKVRIGQTYRQILDEIRSFNISVCLRRNFGVNPGSFGTPRRMRTWGPTTSRHLRQERPLHLRPEMIHPALREKGRAIPQSHVVPKVPIEKEPAARPPPIPGMRPPMGGAGHVVPAPKVGGTMSIVMPLYTIGIVIFFMYTIMKVFVRKTGGDNNFKDFHSDPEFRRVVFSEDYSNGCAPNVGGDGLRQRNKKESPPPVWKTPSDENTRLGWKERDTRDIEIDHLRKRLEETERAMERIVAQMGSVPAKLISNTQIESGIKLSSSPTKDDKKSLEEFCTDKIKPSTKKELNTSEQVDILNKELFWDEAAGKGDIIHEPVGGDYLKDQTKPKVKVMGVETVAECEGGHRWSRPATPNLGVGGHSRSTTPIPPPYTPEPQNIFLEGSLPMQSQLIVTDSETQALTLPTEDDPEPPVILSGKMTLSLISLDAVLPEDGIHHAQPVPEPQCQLFDPENDLDNDYETFGDADSTLFDVDSAVIDESGQIHYDSTEVEEKDEDDDEDYDNRYKQANEREEDLTTNYTTATMSGDAEAFAAELEDTAADVSNIDALDQADDQEEIQEDEEVKIWNGEVENEGEQGEDEERPPPQSNNYQHQR